VTVVCCQVVVCVSG